MERVGEEEGNERRRFENNVHRIDLVSFLSFRTQNQIESHLEAPKSVCLCLWFVLWLIRTFFAAQISTAKEQTIHSRNRFLQIHF